MSKPHKTYTDAMNRKAHRYAAIRAAKDGSINWKFTEQDWTVLKASDTGEVMLVSVKVEIDREKYFKLKKQYLEHAARVNANKGEEK